MPDSKTKCKICGTEIMQITADLHNGCCVPCDVVPAEEATPILDQRYIEIIKDSAATQYLDYLFSADLSDSDPRSKRKQMVIGHSAGLLRIWKDSGKTDLLYPMPGDDSRRYYAASYVLQLFCQRGEYPDRLEVGIGIKVAKPPLHRQTSGVFFCLPGDVEFWKQLPEQGDASDG